jgi:type I restriction enzyme S subunit
MSQALYDLPEGWCFESFKKIVINLDGKRIPIKSDERKNTHGTYPYYGATGIIDYVDEYIFEGENILISEDGANLVARKYPIAFIATGKYWVNNHAHVVNAKSEFTTNSFLKWFFEWFDLSSYITGSAQPKLSQGKLNSIQVPLPPLAEQTRIVEKLDAVLSRIDTAIDELQQSRVLVDAMFKSYLSSLSYETVKLGDLVNITTGRLDANAATDDGEFSFFTCSRETYRIDNYAFDCEAILLAGNNAVGDFNVKHFKGKFNAYQRTYVITVKDNNTLLYRFLYFQLVDSMLRFKNKSIGSGTKFLKIGMIKDLDILLPNLAEQQQLVEALDALNDKTTQLKTELTAKIGMFNQLKASVLDGAFRGELK